jgi:P-type Cu2+ transporter
MNMSDMTKKLYPVTGMHCAACAGNVEKIVRKQEGVENASVNLAAATLAVTYNPDIVSPQQLKEAVMKIGFDLIIDEDNSVQEQEEAEQSYYGQLKRKTIVAWIFALPVAVLGMFLMNVPGVNWWMLLLSLPVILYSGRSFYMNAWKQTLQRTSNMDTLVALSTSIAFLFSLFNTFYPEFWYSRGLEPHVYYEAATIQTRKVKTATARTTGTKTAVTLSTIRWTGALDPCASCTMRIICANTVFFPTF